LENYLPAYSGNPFEIPDSSKRAAVDEEILYLSTQPSLEAIAKRYGGLYTAISNLPGKSSVDYDLFLLPALSQFTLELQQMVVKQPPLLPEQITSKLFNTEPGRARVFEVANFTRDVGSNFSAKIILKSGASGPKRHVIVTQSTNAGMMGFKILDGG
jgi:hypothetical protein